jgi:SAM-dependent methyltransferase
VLRAEAAWLRAQLDQLPAEELSPLLSIGSGGEELRATQPWLQEAVYAPLERRGIRVLHHELERAHGVDVAGDLTDADFLDRLAELEVRSVLCCNVLEHVPNPREVAAALERIVAPGAYALVTVPRRYPYHPGPIDTLFRPTPAELSSFFPTLSCESGTELRTESLLRYLFSSSTKLASVTRGLRTQAPPSARHPLVETLRMAFVSTAVTAVVLRAPVLPSAP